MTDLNTKVVTATKWSAITEITAKLIAPFSTMVLARLLTPEAFGVVATLTMIITFAEIFTDAGFQRYLIQYEFKDDQDKYNTANVAFWSNLTMSIIIWVLIAIFSEPLAKLVGNPGTGYVISIACVSIPLAAFSSIQMALYKRDLDFKTLFYTRIAGILIPIVVTIPLAIWLRNYWALVIGTIAINLSNAIILTAKSKWRPSFYYSFKRLKQMFSFCSWTLIDSVLVWATAYIDIFFIGMMLNEYYLGIYKTSIATVGQITALITSALLPVVMPSLSRLQNNLPEMRRTLMMFQKYTAIILLPLGTGIFLFSDLITDIMLGEKWQEAASFIGLWGLMEAITIIFSRFCSLIFPSIGKPRISVVVQLLHLVVLIPATVISVRYGYEALYLTRSFVRLEGVAVNLIFAYILIKLSPKKMLLNIMPETIGCIVMGITAYTMLQFDSSTLMSFIYIAICIIIYFGTLYLIPSEKRHLKTLFNRLLKK